MLRIRSRYVEPSKIGIIFPISDKDRFLRSQRFKGEEAEFMDLMTITSKY